MNFAIVESSRIVRRTTATRKTDGQQKAAVKMEARRRILARFPDWKQTSMVARAVELKRNVGNLTADEQAEEQALLAAWGMDQVGAVDE